MSLKERLMDDLKTSMKEKQTLRKNTITMLRSRIKQYEVDNRLTADDDLIMQMIQKEIKERNDTLDSLKGTDRAELIKDTEEEISYLSEYLPKQMDDDELNDLVGAVVAEVGATSMKDMGAVMKLAKERSESRVDAKRLSEAVIGRIVPQNGVTNDVGLFLTNVGTTLAFSEAMVKGKPTYERVITVSGSGIKVPKNILVKIGTPVGEILDFCGGVVEDYKEIICGGPMTGKSVFNLNSPITKTTSGILVFTDKEENSIEESPCIRCSRCVDHCPANINPTDINAAILRGRLDICEELHADQCMECGICSFVCPAKRHLSASTKLAKRELKMAQRAKRK